MFGFSQQEGPNMARKTKDRIGLRYGRLAVVERFEVKGLGVGWKCRCDCGKEIYASGYNLESGNTQSCGCLALEARTKHGLTHSRVYTIWKGMHQRCNNPRSGAYSDYGGRGIRVCKEWHRFENFLADMGHPPPRLTLERKDNDGHYEPGNCTWATYSDQLSNRRNNHLLGAFGREQTLTQWSKEYGIPVTTLKNRIYRAGMTVETALKAENHKGVKYDGSPRKQSPRKDNVILDAFGKSQTLTQWSQETGLKASTIRRRMAEGMPVKLALTAPRRRGFRYDAGTQEFVHPRKKME
jgi:hypothetical protein